MKKSFQILIAVIGISILAESLDLISNKTPVSGTEDNASESLIKPTKFQNHKKQNKVKPDQPDQFVQFYNEIRTRIVETTPGYPANYKILELKKAKKTNSLSKSRNVTLPWQERGPGNLGGRTRGLIIHPGDPTHNTWFAGSVGGGIWKTTDGGKSWVNKTPDLPNLATTTLAMSPANHNVIYAGTGEGFYNFSGITGDGIFKSIDGGESWQQLVNNFHFENINRIVVDPSDENVLLVAVNSGFFRPDKWKTSHIYLSTDGGESWLQVYDAGTNRVQQIVANPHNFNTLYACVNSVGIIKSFNRGLSWHLSSSGIEDMKRIELAIAATDTFRLYAAVEVNAFTSNLYISEDGAISWRLSSEEIEENPNWLAAQGWYNNAIAVHPFDKNIVFFGGLNIWRADFQAHGGIGGTIINVEQNNTASFLSFFDFGTTYANGGLTLVDKDDAMGIDKFDYVAVELRFGPGIKQKAHRFSAPDGPGIPPNSYTYEDYIDVPFQVWDKTNQRQIMVSFRDSDNDMEFNLTSIENNIVGREYIFINSVEYNPDAPDPTIALPGGQIYKNIYFIWPILTSEASWDPENLPESNLFINYGAHLLFKRSTELTSWYEDRPNADHESGFFPFVHADHHNLTVVPIDEVMNQFWIVNANDGGIEISKDGGTNWEKTLNGYNTTQHYGVDKKPGEDIYISGMQDNGTWRSPSNGDEMSQWLEQLPGDGFDVSWHYKNPQKIVASTQFNGIYRSVDGGLNWESSVTGLLDFFPFFTSIAKTNSDPDLLFTTGDRGVWRSDNFSEDWILSAISDKNWRFSNRRLPVEISLADPQIVWAGSQMATNNKLHVSVDGGISFTPVNNYESVMGNITGLATHPTNDSTAYALFSFANSPKILRTTDLGNTWQDISGFHMNTFSNNGFPDVATYSLLVLPHQPNIIWAGTEIGLFESSDSGETWNFSNNGLPAVSIWQMRVVDDQVIVATHGRGIWSVTIPELASYSPPVVTLSPRLNPLSQSLDGQLPININLRSVYDSTHIILNNELFFTLFNTTVLDTTIIANPKFNGKITATILSFKEGRKYKTSQREIDVLDIKPAQTFYSNDFNTETDDFTGIGFQITTPDGFSDGAIHSLHPYLKSGNISYKLLTPILVQTSNTFLTFDEIVLVEPGDEGSVFGDSNFKDYVIVEGSKKIENWQPLVKGYDARSDSFWLEAYNAKNDGNPALFKNRTINLLDTFSPGDQILIRFRFSSDVSNNGWGWAIDNLKIQEAATSVEITDNVPKFFSLAQNYPNPFNPDTEIQYTLPSSAKITLNIFNITGQKVRTLVAGTKQEKGSYTITWNAKNDHNFDLPSGIYIVRLQADQFVQTQKMTLVR